MWPALMNNDQNLLKNYLSPIWETTNVFLVAFIVCIFTFFPGSVIYFGTNLMPLIFTSLVFAGLRVLCMLLIFYGDVKSKAVDILLLISCFLFPMILSGFYTYCLNGQTDIIPSSFLGWSLWFLTATIILLLSSSFFLYRTKISSAINKLINWSSAGFFAAMIVFAIAVKISAPYIFNNTPANITALTFLIISIILFFVNLKKQQPLGLFLSAALMVGVVLFSFVLLHLPYLAYPAANVYNSFTDPTAFKIMMWCLPVGLIIVSPGLWLLYYLFAKNKSGSSY